MVLDVEQILYDIIPSVRDDVEKDPITVNVFNLSPGAVAIVAEDSRVVRSMLEQALKGMNIPSMMFATGLDAWNKIKEMAEEAETQEQPK